MTPPISPERPTHRWFPVIGGVCLNLALGSFYPWSVFVPPLDAPLSGNTLIYVLGFPDRDAAKKSWDAFRADAGFQGALKAADANGRVVGSVESVFVEPTDYSPLR